MKRYNAKRILIYRLGSLGDTIVALPCFHLIAHAFPQAKRYLLTNFHSNTKASHPNAILGDSGLVHGYISYPIGLRGPRQLFELRQQIRRIDPDMLIYLAAPRGRAKIFRDILFFKLCGIKKLIGVPYAKKLGENQWLPDQKCYEHEASRLVRCILSLGNVQLDDSNSWDLHLTAKEKSRAEKLLRDAGLNPRLIACSVGAKVDVKNWGATNWKNLINKLYQKYNNFSLMFIGAGNEFDESEDVSRSWPGKKINLCGKLSPRESAAALKYAAIFIGHDSGPMHLSAAVGTPCVAIFSARNKPGVWFPYGKHHKVIYHQTECFGCGLETCQDKGKKCIRSITVDEVLNAVRTVLLHE